MKNKNTGQKLWKKAKTLIPGGNQLLSKRAEMFAPEVWPASYSRAKGSSVWDLDGKKYTDMSFMGIGATMLGYADKDVDGAVIKQAIQKGSMSTLNAPEEVELAEVLLKLHPWAGMVRYARTGGEAMAIAARIARACTGRDVIAFCGYHGWADWYLATNLQTKDALAAHLLRGLEPKGVPKSLRGSIVPFRYNHPEELEAIVKKYGKLAAIIMEPVHGEAPQKSFLTVVRALANKAGAVLVFDEITMGFRLNLGGAHLKYGVMPDMAIFAKGMSNGYPMAAIIGKKPVMQAAQDTFISSTYWTERIGPVAALATIKKMRDKKVQAKLAALGRKVRVVWRAASKNPGLPMGVSGVDPLQFFSFDGKDAQVIKTVFVTEMLKHGFLASNLYYASYVHTDADVKRYAKALNAVFDKISRAQKAGALQKLLKGPVGRTGFQRLN